MHKIANEIQQEFPGCAAAGWQVQDIVLRLAASKDADATAKELVSKSTLAGMLKQDACATVVAMARLKLGV